MSKQLTFSFTGFRGLDSSSGIENLGPVPDKPDHYALSILQNGRVTQDGGVYIRKGLEKIATLDSDAKVDTLLGVENDSWQVMLAKSGTKIYQSKDPDSGLFYTIGASKTASERDFFFPKRKDVYDVNQTDNFFRIAVSIIASINVAGSTVTLRTGDGESFSVSGTIYIRGIAVTYSGKSTNTLTGCTGLTAAMIADDIVTQTTSYASNPKGSCMGELEGSALVGGVSADKSGLYWSEPSSTANPELFYDFPTNYVTPLPRDITAIKSGNRATLIGMSKGLKYTAGFEPTVGDPVIVAASSAHSVPNAFCIDQLDEDFVILTGDGRILPAGQTDAGFKIVEDPKNPRGDMDYPVQGFLQKNAAKDDASDNFVHYDPSARIAYSSIKMNEGFTKDVVLQRDIGAWSIDTGKAVSCRTMFKGKTYAGSMRNGHIYLDNSIITDEGNEIDFRMVTGLMSLDERRVQFDLLNLHIGGLLSAIGVFNVYIYADGSLVFSDEVTAEELIEKGLMDVTTGIPIGYGNVGHEQVGTGGEVIEGFAFTYPLECSIECNQTLQIEIQVVDSGTSAEFRSLRADIETEGSSQFNTF